MLGESVYPSVIWRDSWVDSQGLGENPHSLPPPMGQCSHAPLLQPHRADCHIMAQTESQFVSFAQKEGQTFPQESLQLIPEGLSGCLNIQRPSTHGTCEKEFIEWM